MDCTFDELTQQLAGWASWWSFWVVVGAVVRGRITDASSRGA